MNEDKGTLQLIAEHLALAIEPLRRATSDLEQFKILMWRLGWEAESLPPAYTNLTALVVELISAAEALADEAELDEIIEVIEKVGDVYNAIKGISEAPAGVDAGAFLGEIGETLFEYLLVGYLAAAFPSAYTLLEMLDVIVHESHESTDGRPGYVHSRLLYDEIPKILSDPISIPARVYGWGTDDLDFELLAEHLFELFTALNLLASIEGIDAELGDAFQDGPFDDAEKSIDTLVRIALFETEVAGTPVEPAIIILELPAEGTHLPGIIVQPSVPEGIDADIQIDDDWSFHVRAGTDLASTFGIVLRPGELSIRYPFQPGTELPSAGFGVLLKYAPDTASILLGHPSATRLQIVGATVAFDLDNRMGELGLRLEMALEGLALVLAIDEQDGFIGKLFGDSNVTIQFPLVIQWSSRTGLGFSGSAGFEFSYNPHLQLGPITIQEVQLGIRTTLESTQPPDLTTHIGVSFGGRLGPVIFAVEDVGLRLVTVFEDGNAGPFDIEVGFKPPRGVGLAIDAESVKGGGYLRFDAPNERYEGILYLSFGEIALTAIALITTRLPDGSKGFSMLAIIGVEFDPAYALGYGFFLKGVGGLIGIHRTMDLDAIQDGIRTGAIDSILFPSDPIANAPKIISDLRSIFPPQEDRYVIGPMVIITWGVPTIISAEIAILIEIPSPIRLAILGQLLAILPDEEEDLVQLRLDVAGLIDFGKGTLSIDASLYDSHLLEYPIEGDMALRSGSGYFAMAVGGFHPAYTPPPGFPSLRLISVSIGSGKNPRLNLDSYFALTENTVQFGARFELYAEMSKFNVYGVLGFDTIFRFSPFEFVADIYASVDLRLGGKSLMSVKLDFTLQGPAPWRARGKAKFKILFVKYKKSFDKTFGRSADTVLPPLDPWLPFKEALEEQNNWVAVLPAGRQPPVSVRDARLQTAEEADAGGSVTPPPIVIDPVGELIFKQKVVPLGVQITRFGNGRPEVPVTFHVTAVGADLTVVDEEDLFPPGQFWDRSESELLSAKGESHKSGLRMSGSTASYVDPVAMDVEFEEGQFPEIPDEPFIIVKLDRMVGLVNAAISSSAKIEQVSARLSGFGLPAFETKVQVVQPRYVIATTEDLTVVEALHPDFTPVTWTEAEARLSEHLALHPEDLGAFQVVPQVEAIMP